MSTKRLRFLLISLIVLIVLAGAASAAAAITMANESIEWFMGMRCESSMEEK